MISDHSSAWRLLVDRESPGDWNMAVDEAILDAVAAGMVPPTLRLYRWDGPVVSLGRFQSRERDFDEELGRELGIGFVRRPTGGRGILHGHDQTVSIIVPIRLLGETGRRVIESYVYLSLGFVEAFRSLKLAVYQPECERRSQRGGDCFATRSRADLITDTGEKLVGSAQRRHEGTILQQTSIRHLPDSEAALRIFKGPHGQSTFPMLKIGVDKLEKALRKGFETALGIQLTESSLTGWELERAGLLLAEAREGKLVDSRTSL